MQGQRFLLYWKESLMSQELMLTVLTFYLYKINEIVEQQF